LKTCGKDHAGEISGEVGQLPDSQAGFWRHRCAGCAYLLGRKHAAETEERLRERIRTLEARWP
jgi:hypothetical protein